MKVTVLLRNDHEALMALFNKFRKPSNGRASNGKKDLFDEIEREIRIHSQMKREIFYSALGASSSTETATLVGRAEQQLESIEKLLQQLSGISVSEKSFETTMTSLIDEVTRHFELDEQEIFDEARKILPEYRLEELGLELEDRRKILATLAA